MAVVRSGKWEESGRFQEILRDSERFRSLDWGGILFENRRGDEGELQTVMDDVCGMNVLDSFKNGPHENGSVAG